MDGSYKSWAKSEPTGSAPLSPSAVWEWDELVKELGLDLDQEEFDIQRVLTRQLEDSNPTQDVAVLPPETITHIPSQDVELTEYLLAVFKKPCEETISSLRWFLERTGILYKCLVIQVARQPRTIEECIAVDLVREERHRKFDSSFSLPENCTLREVSDGKYWFYVTKKDAHRPSGESPRISIDSPLYSFLMQCLWQGKEELFSKCWELLLAAGHNVAEPFDVRISSVKPQVTIKRRGSLEHMLIMCGRCDLIRPKRNTDDLVTHDMSDLITKHAIANGHLSSYLTWIKNHVSPEKREAAFQRLKEPIRKLYQENIITQIQDVAFHKAVEEHIQAARAEQGLAVSDVAPRAPTQSEERATMGEVLLLDYLKEVKRLLHEEQNVMHWSCNFPPTQTFIKTFYDAVRIELFPSLVKKDGNPSRDKEYDVMLSQHLSFKAKWKPIIKCIREEQNWELQKPKWGEPNLQSNLFFLPQKKIMKSVDPQFFIQHKFYTEIKEEPIALRELLFNKLSYEKKRSLFQLLIHIQRYPKPDQKFERIALYLDANRQFGYSYTLPQLAMLVDPKLLNLFPEGNDKSIFSEPVHVLYQGTTFDCQAITPFVYKKDLASLRESLKHVRSTSAEIKRAEHELIQESLNDVVYRKIVKDFVEDYYSWFFAKTREHFNLRNKYDDRVNELINILKRFIASRNKTTSRSWDGTPSRHVAANRNTLNTLMDCGISSSRKEVLIEGCGIDLQTLVELILTSDGSNRLDLSYFFHDFLTYFKEQKGERAQQKLLNEKIIIDNQPITLKTLLSRFQLVGNPIHAFKCELYIPRLMQVVSHEEQGTTKASDSTPALASAEPSGPPEAPAASLAANTVPDLNQPLPPKALRHIATQLEARWVKNPVAHRAFLNALKEGRGSWSISIDQPKLAQHVLAPLIEMLRNAAPAHREAVLMLVHDIVSFMHLHSHAPHGFLNVLEQYRRGESLNDESLERIVWHHILPPPSPGTGTLSPTQTDEVLETLFSAKMHELRLRIEANKLRRGIGPSQTFPAFLSHNNLDKAHLEILSAQFYNGSLVGFAQPTQAAFGLLERAGIGHKRTTGKVEANATVEQFSNLKDRIAEPDTPGYIFARLQYRAQMPASAAHQEPAIIEEDPAAPVQEEAPPPKPKRSHPETTIDREEEALRKRLKGKEEVEDMEIEVSPIIGPPPAPSSLPGSSMNRGDGKQKPYVLAPTGKFQRASHEPPPRPKPQAEPPEGEILPVANPMGDRSLASDSSAPAFSLDNLWSALSKDAAEKTLNKMRLQAAKAATVRKERLTIPRYTALKAAGDAPITSLPELNRLLKDYQKQDLDELIHYAADGFSKLLCYEMGVGKTFVYGSAIVHRLYEGLKGHVLVATPGTIRESIHEELKVILREGVLTAWEVSLRDAAGRWNRQDGINRCLLSKLQSNNADDKRLGLMMLGSLSLGEVEAFFRWLQQQKGGKQVAGKVLNRQFIDEHMHAAESFLRTLCDKLQSLPDKRAQVEETLQRIEETRLTSNVQHLLWVTGQVLAFHPARKAIPQNASFDKDGIDRLLNFSFSALNVRKNGQLISRTITSPTDFNITILSHEGLQKLESHLQLSNVGAIVIDEMQKLEKGQSIRTKHVKSIVNALHKKAQVIGVSGTPMENNFDELVTLISLVNPTLFDEKTIRILRALLKAAGDAMQVGNQEAVMTAFARITAFNENVLQPLLLRRMQEDEVVRDAWNDLITTLVHEEQQFSITDRVSAAYRSIFESSRNPFERDSKFNRIFLHPSLQNITHFETNDPKVQEYLQRIQSAADEAFDNLIAESPYLNWVINSPHLEEALRTNKKVLIFAKHTAVVHATVEALNKKSFQAESFCGDASTSVVDRFKSTPGARVLVTTYDKGGTGFNINEADVVMLLQEEYNPGKLAQAIFRIKRVGTKKRVTVVRPENEDLYPLQHMKSILKNKELLFQFLFHKFDSRLEQYAHWLDLLKGEIYIAQLNNLNGDVTAAQTAVEEVEARTVDFLFETTEEQLNEEIEAVRPRAEPQPLPPAPAPLARAPAPIATAPTPSLSVTAAKTQRQSQSQLASTARVNPTPPPVVRLRGTDYQKLPVPGAGMLDAIRAGIYLYNRPGLREEGNLVGTLLSKFYHDAGLRRHVREPKEKRAHNPHLPGDVKMLVDAFEGQIPLIELDQAFLSYNIEIYRYDISDNTYTLTEQYEAAKGPVIRLLQTDLGNQKSYYDVLVHKPWKLRELATSDSSQIAYPM